MECRFYVLQKKLREEGWYVEWSPASDGGDAWVDVPAVHEEGPFEGLEIDQNKCLLAFTNFDDERLHPWAYLPRPEGLSDEEWDVEVQNLMDSLHDGDIGPIVEFLGGEDQWESLLASIPENTPEGLGGNYFMMSGKDIALENLNAVLPFFAECGCSYKDVSREGIEIEWVS